MAEQTIAAYGNTFSLRPNRQGGCYNILELALSTTGHVGTWVLNPNASGDSTSTLIGAILSEQVGSWNEESPP